MGRLVQPESRGPRPEMVGSGQGQDEYAARIAKYIPSEVLAAYLTLENTLAPTATTAAALAAPAVAAKANIMDVIGPHMPVGVFLLCLVFTPIYIWSFSWKSKGPWVIHALVATLAFCVWAYAMRGSLFTAVPLLGGAPLYNGQLAAAMLVVFSLISGLIRPEEKAP
jgi:hypothetical protein